MAQSIGRKWPGGSSQRARQAFAHQRPDRTPLFELYWSWQPIFWDVVGRNPATDEGMCFDALVDGIDWEEMIELEAQAIYQTSRFFEVDVIFSTANGGRGHGRPKVTKLGEGRWERGGRTFFWNPVTARVELESTTAADADSNKWDEQKVKQSAEQWDGTVPPIHPDRYARFRRIKQLAEADGVDWLYMGEEGGGTGAAQYPEWMFMWMLDEPEAYRRWLEMHAARGRAYTQAAIENGADIIALGGDVSYNRGPVISPGQFREFILPVIRRQVDLIHGMGALAVYTSDGNHFPIKEDFFYNSAIDGYKECDYAAGMTMQRLVEEGVKDRVTIIGNVDARHVLCRGTPQQARQATIECLEWGAKTPGGHILATSHSVHEGVRNENYYAMIDAYREYFGLPKLPEPPFGRQAHPPSVSVAGC